jgi:hypothetical protein
LPLVTFLAVPFSAAVAAAALTAASVPVVVVVRVTVLVGEASRDHLSVVGFLVAAVFALRCATTWLRPDSFGYLPSVSSHLVNARGSSAGCLPHPPID